MPEIISKPTRDGALVALLLVIGSLALKAADGKTCASCHAEIYRRYLSSPMAKTSGIAGASAPRESFAHASFDTANAHYEISPEYEFTFASGGVEGRRGLDYFIGSGLVGRSYLTAIDGFLFQTPVSYYSGPAAWALSPGYERSETIHLTREVEPGCLNCHATGLQPLAGTSNGYANPPFREAGVSCERCHGSGDAHAASPGAGTIVNPAKLAGARRWSVCAQCHLPGAVEIANSPGRPYQPGGLLADSVSIFIWEGATRETTINGHFEQLARSACRRASGDKMWCGTCHDPHATSTNYREKCLACHAASACKASPPARAGSNDNCIACHMPRSKAATVLHAAYTDHSIARRPRPDAPFRIAADARLIPFDGFRSGGRELGLAYANAALGGSNRAWGMRAFDLLLKANEENPQDTKVAVSLAQLYDRMGNEKEACRLYAGVAGATPSAASNYGTCLAKDGKLDEAMRVWSSVLRRNPGNESARLNLAVAQLRSGKTEEARANLTEALRFNPVSKAARDLLSEARR